MGLARVIQLDAREAHAMLLDVNRGSYQMRIDYYECSA